MMCSVDATGRASKRLVPMTEIFRRVFACAGKSVEEVHMIMHFPDTGCVLCRDNRRMSRLILNNGTIEMNDPVAHDNLQRSRPPAHAIDRPDDAVANMIIVRSGVGYLSGRAGKRP